MDAPHAQVAELAAGALGVVADHRDVLQFGGDVVRGHDAVGERGGGDVGLGAHDQRVLELARALHRAARDGAVVAGDEVHQAEVERLDAVERGDLPGLAQGTVGLDQHVHRQRARQAAGGLDAAQFADLFGGVGGGAHLGNGDEGQSIAGAADQDLEVALPVRVGDVVDARSDAAEVVLGAIDDLDHHARVLGLGPRARAVLAVAGDVEHRAELLLQLERLEHQLLGAGVVVDGGEGGEGFFAGEQDLGGVKRHGGLLGWGAVWAAWRRSCRRGAGRCAGPRGAQRK